MNASSRNKHRKEMREDEIAAHSSLFRMTKSEAIEVINSSLLEFRVYCKKNDLKFLLYLIEMAALEAMEVQMSLTNEHDKDER